jgi:putative component of membrane protein insertase Oxa1/YidC/SpoIIIJ protein YidD
MARRRRWCGQRWLVRAIRGYRRHLSGRGPFARVRCTFEHQESCSRYALRYVIVEAAGLVDALCAIRARLRRCHGLAIYLDVDGALIGGGDFDLLARPGGARALLRGLTAARELGTTRAAIRRSAVLVAEQQGWAVGALLADGNFAVTQGPGGLLLLRSARVLERSVWMAPRRRLIVCGVVAVGLILHIWLFGSMPMVYVVLAGCTARGLWLVADGLAEKVRLANLRARCAVAGKLVRRAPHGNEPGGDQPGSGRSVMRQ